MKASITSEVRLPPPAHLSEAVRAEWLLLVNDQPAGSFRETHAPMIEMYCKHLIKARSFDNAIEALDPSLISDEAGMLIVDKLCRMAERESRAASSLATRLRITRQAVDHGTTVANKLKNQTKGAKPWQSISENEN
jgi:hypothetical protein